MSVLPDPPTRPEPRAAKMPGAQIYDLHYATYDGPRSSAWVRTWIIAREIFLQSWKSKWLRRCMWSGFMIATGFAFAIYFQMQKTPPQLAAAKLVLPQLDTYVLWAISRGLVFVGVLAATIVGGAAVSDDLRAGAFQFYFARPLRPHQYALGKLAGVTMAVSLVVLIPAISLALVRVFLEDDFTVMMKALPVLPKTLALAGGATLAIAGFAVLVSSFTPRRIYAQATFAIIVFVTFAMGPAMKALLRNRNAAVISLRDAVEAFGYGLFDKWILDRSQPADWQVGMYTLVGVFVVSTILLLRRIRRIELSSLGT